MPRVHKTHDYEAVRLAVPVLLVNERTGPRGKPIPAGSIQITDLQTGEQWYVRPDEFTASGWAAVDPADGDYFRA